MEAQPRCYPTRGDSLAYYSQWFGRRLVYALLSALLVLLAAGAGTILTPTVAHQQSRTAYAR
jgi:hypothetical protein